MALEVAYSCFRRYKEPERDAAMYTVGVSLMVLSCVFLSIGLAVQNKSVHREKQKSEARDFTRQPKWLSGTILCLVGHGLFLVCLALLQLMVFAPVALLVHLAYYPINIFFFTWRPPMWRRDILAVIFVIVGAALAIHFGYVGLTCLDASSLTKFFSGTDSIVCLVICAVIISCCWGAITYIELILKQGMSSNHAVAAAVPSTAAAPESTVGATAVEVVHVRHGSRSLSNSCFVFGRRFLHQSLGPWFVAALPFTAPTYLHSFGTHDPWVAANTHRTISILPMSNEHVSSLSSIELQSTHGTRRSASVMSHEIGHSFHVRARSGTFPAPTNSQAWQTRMRSSSEPHRPRASSTTIPAPHRRRSSTEIVAQAVQKANGVMRRSAVGRAVVLARIDCPPPAYMRYCRLHPCAYAIMMAGFSAGATLALKVLGELIKTRIYGHAGATGNAIGATAVAAMGLIMLHQHSLSRALQLFDAPYLLPLYFAMYTSLLAVFGIVIFNEVSWLPALNGAMLLVGICLALIGGSILADQSSDALFPPTGVPAPVKLASFRNFFRVSETPRTAFLRRGWSDVISSEEDRQHSPHMIAHGANAV